MTALLAVLAVSPLTACGDDGADGPDAGSGGPGLESVVADVRRLAPALESYYRNRTYPRTLEDVTASLADAKLEPAAGNSLGAYRYDADAVEFVLCVENAEGAFATYDTAPMAVGTQGRSGGCPDL